MNTTLKRRNIIRLVLTCAALLVIAGLATARSLSGSITVTNNSSRTIVHLYVSHANADDWSNDHLNGNSLTNGESFTISNLNWDEPTIKLIGEDQDGCFLSAVVASNDNVTWAITNGTAANCGGGGN
jgi:hypothetical protein